MPSPTGAAAVRACETPSLLPAGEGAAKRRVRGAALLLLLACGPQGGGKAKDEGKVCAMRADCVEVCATVCSGLDAGATFRCTSFDNALNACLCGVTVDGGVRPLGC